MTLRGRSWSVPVLLAWLLGVIPSLAIVAAFAGGRTISHEFFTAQDQPMLIVCLGFFAIVGLPWTRLGEAATARLSAMLERRSLTLALTVAALVATGAFAGWWTLYHAYPLSMDEVSAVFDARIMAHGHLMAPVAPAWRDYVPALQPLWVKQAAGHQAWVSIYLPMNAVFRAAFSYLGSQALAGPFWAGLSVILVWAIARDLWPKRRDAAAVSALMLATSSQLLFTAMSPYAMSAHLALNLVWLWLFLRRQGPWRMAGPLLAIIVAFAATGLHQFIFHPLFAAPFVVGLWLRGHWRLAGVYTVAYGSIVLFWMCYWGLVIGHYSLSGHIDPAQGVSGVTQSALALISLPSLSGIGLMGENLVRLVAWQNPLGLGLAALGAILACKTRHRVLLPAAVGIVAAILAMLVILPFQGHGWGYRYLHGNLGSLALLAAFAWVETVDSADSRSPALAALALSCLVLPLILLPLAGRQVSDFITPFSRASAAIARSGAEVVIVDPRGLWYADDLVRNDPFLEHNPKVMNLAVLTEPQLRNLCAGYRVGVFDFPQGKRLGMRSAGAVPIPSSKTALLKSLGCDRPVLKVGH